MTFNEAVKSVCKHGKKLPKSRIKLWELDAICLTNLGLPYCIAVNVAKHITKLEAQNRKLLKTLNQRTHATRSTPPTSNSLTMRN